MIAFFNRWTWYKEAMLARSMEMHRRELLAFEAESNVQSRFDALDSTLGSWNGLRIPNVLSLTAAGETDVIVLTRWGVLLVEVKNWSGSITIDDKFRIRQSGKKGKPVLQKINEKLTNLKRIFLERTGSDIEAECVVVFANKHATLSKEIQAHSQITRNEGIDSIANDLLSGRAMLSKGQIDLYKSFLNSFGTFDRLCTPAGLCEFGDINDNETTDLFDRQLHSAVDIELGRGLISTLIFGPRLKVTIQSRDGSKHIQWVEPGPRLSFSQPWIHTVQSVESRPIEFYSRICFGTQATVLEDSNGRQVSIVPKATEAVTENGVKDESVLTSLKQASAREAQRFNIGSTHTATIKHLIYNKNGALDGILVWLVHRKVQGLVGRESIRELNPGILPLYTVGKSVDVTVLRNDGPKKILLGL